ncbi:uncharacterized protein LOC144359582 [Saccoglossus kowalevskii]
MAEVNPVSMSSTRKGCRGSPRLNTVEHDTTFDSDTSLNLQSKEESNEEHRINDSEPSKSQQQPVSEMRRKLRQRPARNSHFLRKPFVCGICNAAFKYEQVLVYHVRSHTGEKPYECDKCDFSAIQPASLQKHKKIAHLVASFDCEDCGLTFSKNATLKLHRDMHRSQGLNKTTTIHDQKIKKNVSDLKDIATDSSKVLLKTTQQSKTKSQAKESTNAQGTEVDSSSSSNPKPQNTESVELFLCEICSFTCHGEENYEQHIQQHKDGKIVLNSEFEFPKPSTSTVLEEKHRAKDFDSQLIARTDKDGNKYWLCCKCSYVRFTKKSAFVHHMVSCQHRVVYSCESCDYICVKMCDLETHKQEKHAPPLSPKLPTQVIYSCEVCCFMTTKFQELSAHRKRVHILPDLSCTYFNFKQKIIFSCEVCDYVSSSLVDLNLHKLTSKHNPEVVDDDTKKLKQGKSKKRSDKTSFSAGKTKSLNKSSSNKPDASTHYISKDSVMSSSDASRTINISNNRTVINVKQTDGTTDSNKSRKIIIAGIKCADCQQSFRSAYEAEHHRKEVKDNWYQCRCHVCKFPGKSPCDLECHKQKFHRHVCKMCDVNCGTEYKLMSHTQLVHPFIFKHKYGDRKIEPDLLQAAKEISPQLNVKSPDRQKVKGNKSRLEGKYVQVAVPVVPVPDSGKQMKFATKNKNTKKIETNTNNCVELSSSFEEEVVAVHEFWPMNGSQRSLQNLELQQKHSFEQKRYTCTSNFSARNRRKSVQMRVPGMVQFSSLGLPLFPEYGKTDEQRRTIPFPLLPVEDIEDNMSEFQINRMNAALLSLFIDEAMLKSCRTLLRKRKRWSHYSLIHIRNDSTIFDVSRVHLPETAPLEVNNGVNKDYTSNQAPVSSAHRETDQSSVDRSIKVTLDMIRKIQLLVREGTLTPQLTREIAPHCQVICNQFAALQDKLHHVEIINFIITKRTGIGLEALAAASAQIDHSPSSPTQGSSLQQTSAENGIEILKNLLVTSSPIRNKSSSPARKCKKSPRTIETKKTSGCNDVSSLSATSPRKRPAGQDMVQTQSKRLKNSTELSPRNKSDREEDERNLSLYMYSERKSKKAAEKKMKACTSSPRSSASQQSHSKCKGRVSQEFTETNNEHMSTCSDGKIKEEAHTSCKEDKADSKVVKNKITDGYNGKTDDKNVEVVENHECGGLQTKHRNKRNELRQKNPVIYLQRVSPRHHSRSHCENTDHKISSEHSKNNKRKGKSSTPEGKTKPKAQRVSKSVNVTTDDRNDSESETPDSVDNINLKSGNKRQPSDRQKLKMQETLECTRTLRRRLSVQYQEKMKKAKVKRYPLRHGPKIDESKQGRITRNTPSPKY